MNQIRSVLLERGYVAPQGRAKLAGRLAEIVADPACMLSLRMRHLIGDMRERWELLDQRIAALDEEFHQHCRSDDQARRLTDVPGIGSLNATALVAAVGDARTFAHGRDLAAWLGLVPRQATTGGKRRLLGGSKRGSKYLCKIPIQGARAALPTLRNTDTRLGVWLRGCSRGRTPTQPWWHLRPKWSGLSGRSCVMSARTKPLPWLRLELAGADRAG